MIKQINADGFLDEVIKFTKKPVLVEFYATWCGYCKKMAPVFEKVAGEYEGIIKTVKIDIDLSQELAEQMNVNSTPTFFLFKDNKVVAKHSGVMLEDEIKSWIKINLA